MSQIADLVLVLLLPLLHSRIDLAELLVKPPPLLLERILSACVALGTVHRSRINDLGTGPRRSSWSHRIEHDAKEPAVAEAPAGMIAMNIIYTKLRCAADPFCGEMHVTREGCVGGRAEYTQALVLVSEAPSLQGGTHTPRLPVPATSTRAYTH